MKQSIKIVSYPKTSLGMNIGILLFEKGIQEFVTQTVKRYAKANNKSMTGQYNPYEKNTIFNI